MAMLWSLLSAPRSSLLGICAAAQGAETAASSAEATPAASGFAAQPVQARQERATPDQAAAPGEPGRRRVPKFASPSAFRCMRVVFCCT